MWFRDRSLFPDARARRLAGALTFLALLFTPACRPRRAASGGETLWRRLEGEPATLNPILQSSDYEAFVLAGVSRNLVDIDRHLAPVAGLCDRWTSSGDGRELTFHISPAAYWEDGSPVTARDAVFTLERVVDPKVPAVLFSGNFEGMKAATAIDEKTFRVSFAEPYAFRLFAFNLPLLPAAHYEKADWKSAPENRAPVSDGPYRFVRWLAGESIELARNRAYRGPAPGFEKIVFRILPDNGQAYRAIEQGAIDEMRLTTEQWKGSAGDPAFGRCCRSDVFFDLSFLYVGYNNRSPLFADAATRQALTMLLDRPSIAKELAGGMARPISAPWPADFAGLDPAIAPYPFDPAEARRLLARAGWKPSAGGELARGGQRFAFELLYGAGAVSAEQIAALFARELGRAGIACTPRPLDSAALFQRMDAGDFESVVAAWSGDPNPDPFPYWHSSQAPPNGLNNLSFRNPDADRLMEQARRELDPTRRNALYRKLHAIFHAEEPATFILQNSQKYAFSRRLTGIETTAVGPYKFWPGAVGWAPAVLR
jgi:peptide/nickel transport system substrate-binding protein